MTNKAIYMIHRPSPMLGRSPIQGGFFPYKLTEKYIAALQNELDRSAPGWTVFADDTESDINLLAERNPTLLVCAPGLRYQFYHQGFDEDKIIWLSVLEYASADPESVIKRLRELACYGS
ncbi:hypothetical protein CTZ24_24190 (plasmid) [Pantoea phytobeneficialis]|uniref:Uncharacterized protein n=1 Tax=Pantoea phytobeneficialis TaxID=2052056 RepID=A0AAP9HB16_9GAMM|nr:hypothetical protein CTZ24_24190 [Pantoea phytobeneficialis]